MVEKEKEDAAYEASICVELPPLIIQGNDSHGYVEERFSIDVG